MRKIFKRTESARDVNTHYCPGCTHGVIHRIIAEVLDELDLRERAIGIAPVGCSVLIYNYLNCDFQGAAHGRAAAFATGAKRLRPNNIVFTYQGDGDLAAIGFNETIHSANRGEKITVIFVNNAIYGMTGGQMAPTTMPNQKTTTCPAGRDVKQFGYPMRVAEILAQLVTPIYVARGAVHSPEGIIQTKQFVKKAFEYQRDNVCFSLVEVLSVCPTNWGLSPIESNKWLEDKMMPYYRTGEYRTPEKEVV